MAVARDYSHWTGLADDAKVRLSGVIADGVAQGKNPKSVVADIQDSLNVTRSKARQMAQTDIVGTLRETRWAESDAARDELGIEVRMLWTSALRSSTRKTHSAKHGKVFSTNQVREFYSKDGNRYNCYCAQTEALVDENGKLIASDTLKQGMARQRDTWEKEHE
jgi:SPP1 gp7 family putative phage head morphogenesis protein